MVTLLCTAPLLQAVQSQAAPGDTAQTPDSIESFDPPTQTLSAASITKLSAPYRNTSRSMEAYRKMVRHRHEWESFDSKSFLREIPFAGTSERRGSFRLSPDHGQQEFSLRFKSSKRPSTPQPSGDII